MFAGINYHMSSEEKNNNREAFAWCCHFNSEPHDRLIQGLINGAQKPAAIFRRHHPCQPTELSLDRDLHSALATGRWGSKLFVDEPRLKSVAEL